MARIFIQEKDDGFYVRTYKGIVKGPYSTYKLANASTLSFIKYPRKSPRKKSVRKSLRRSK
jgi:hypothetical protein